jgi:hypothetical protein
MMAKDKLPVRRVQRDRRLTPEEAARDREIREKVQQEFADGVPRGGSMTMGDYFDIEWLLADLKAARRAQGLDLAELSRRTGVEESELTALESGPQWKVTLHALVRYARAVGKRLTVNLEDMPEAAEQTR